MESIYRWIDPSLNLQPSQVFNGVLQRSAKDSGVDLDDRWTKQSPIHTQGGTWSKRIGCQNLFCPGMPQCLNLESGLVSFLEEALTRWVLWWPWQWSFWCWWPWWCWPCWWWSWWSCCFIFLCHLGINIDIQIIRETIWLVNELMTIPLPMPRLQCASMEVRIHWQLLFTSSLVTACRWHISNPLGLLATNF